MPRRSAAPPPAKRSTSKRRPPSSQALCPTTDARAPRPDLGLFPEIRQPKKRAFLAAFATCGVKTQAADQAGVDRRSHYNWLADPDYAEAFSRAEDMAGDSLEQEAIRRAMAGSDVLLIFLLKAARPTKFRDNVHHEHAGKVTLEELVAASRLPEHDHA